MPEILKPFKYQPLIALLLLLSAPVFSQSINNYTINWKDTIRTTQLSDFQKHTVLTFPGCLFKYEKYGILPLFAQQFEVNDYGTVEVKIVNPVYGPLTSKEN